MLKKLHIPNLLTICLLFIVISFLVYTVSQAAYWNETRRTQHGREGTVYDYDLAEEGGASAYASVSKNYEERRRKVIIISPGTCPLGSQCPVDYCEQCRVTYFYHEFGTEVDTCSQVSCSQVTDGRRSQGGWSLLASEHQQPQIWGEVRGSTHRNHYKSNFYRFKKPDEVKGRASGSIYPARFRADNAKFNAETEVVEF